jgi:hypothetical protein
MGRPGCSSCCEESKKGCIISTYDVCYLGIEGLRCEREDPSASTDDEDIQKRIGDYIKSLAGKQFQYGGFDIPNVTDDGLVQYKECKSDYAEYSSYATPWLFPVTFLSPDLGIAHIDEGKDEDGNDIKEGANFSPHRNGLDVQDSQMVGTHIPRKWTVYLKSLDDDDTGVIKIENEWDFDSNWDEKYISFVYHGEKYGFDDFHREIKCKNRNNYKAEIPQKLYEKWEEKYIEAINPDEDPDMKTTIKVIKTVYFRTFYRSISGLSKKKKSVPVVIKYTLNNDGSPVDLGIEDEDFGRKGRIEANEIYLYCWDYDDNRKKWLPLHAARKAMGPHLPDYTLEDDFNAGFGQGDGDLVQTSFDFLTAGTYDEFAWCLTYPFMTHTDGFAPGGEIRVNQSGPIVDGVRQMTDKMPTNEVYEEYEELLSGQLRRGVSITNIPSHEVGARHFGESAFKCIVVQSEEFLILNPYVKNIMIEDEWFDHYDYEYPTLAEEVDGIDDAEEERDEAKLRDGIVNKHTDPKLTPVEKPEKPERDDFPEGEGGDEEFEEAMEEYEEKLEEYNKYLEDLLENYKILKRLWGDTDFSTNDTGDGSTAIFTYRDVKINLEKDIPQTIYTTYAPLGLWNHNATPISRDDLNDPNVPQCGTIDAAVGGVGDTAKDIEFPRQQQVPAFGEGVADEDSVLSAPDTIEEYEDTDKLKNPLFRNAEHAYYQPQSFFGLLVNDKYDTSSGTGTGGAKGDRLRDVIVVKLRSMRAVPQDKVDEMLEHGLVWYPIGGCDLLSITDSVIGVSGQPETLTLSNGDECDISEVESASDIFTYAMGDSTYQLQTSYLHGMFRNPFYYRVRSISLINPERDVYPDHEGGPDSAEIHVDDIAYVNQDLKRGSIVITHDGKEHLNPTRIKLTGTSSWTKLPEDERCPENEDEDENTSFVKVLAYGGQPGDPSAIDGNATMYALGGGRECRGFLSSDDDEQDFFLEALPLHGLKAKNVGESFGKICNLSENAIVLTPRVSFANASRTETSACCAAMLEKEEEEEGTFSSGGSSIDSICPEGGAREMFFDDNIVYPTAGLNIMKIYRELTLENNFTFNADGGVKTQIEQTFKGSQKPNFGYLFGTYLTLEFELEQLAPAKDNWGTESANENEQ